MTTTTYTADRNDLLIVDLCDDFMSEGGKLYERNPEPTPGILQEVSRSACVQRLVNYRVGAFVRVPECSEIPHDC